MTKEEQLDQIKYWIGQEEYRLKAFKRKKFPSTFTLYKILAKTKDLFIVIGREEFEQKGEWLLRLSVLKTQTSLLLKDFNRQERIRFKL